MKDSFWNWLLYIMFLATLCIFLVFFLVPPVSGSCETPLETTTSVSESFSDFELELALENADVNQPAIEVVTFEDFFRENSIRIDSCIITHYCAEKRSHICGTGDGITATGVPVTPYWTCAVDPSVIPYGAEVMVDYGDRVEFWKAQDSGVWINGNHIDLAVESHSEALERGTLTATVYWMEEKHGEN